MPTVTAVNYSWSISYPYALIMTFQDTGVLGEDTTKSGNSLSVSAVNGKGDFAGAILPLASGATLQMDSDGPFDYEPVSGVYSDSFTYTATDGIDSATGTVTVNVTQGTPYVAGVNAVSLTYGTPLDNSQLSGAASVAGVFTYTTDGGSVPTTRSGQYPNVTFTPTDNTDYTSVATTVALCWFGHAHRQRHRCGRHLQRFGLPRHRRRDWGRCRRG